MGQPSISVSIWFPIKAVAQTAKCRQVNRKFANAGVGENDIDSPFRLRNGLIKAIKVRQLGNVSLNTKNVGAHCLHGLIEFLLAAAGDEDKGALFDEKL
jgi:hypothetical protein